LQHCFKNLIVLKVKSIISKAAAIILLALYCLSIMPRAVVHVIAANHTDVFVQEKKQNNEQVSSYKLHCELQDQVCTEPCLPAYANVIFSVEKYLASQLCTPTQNFYTKNYTALSLRGPPSFS
jgi:hypothetical protein